MVQRHLMLAYAVIAYGIAALNLVYLMGFISGHFVPKGINDGVVGEIWHAITVNLGLIWLFGLHHTITARSWFKKYWTRIVPKPIERATYLYMTAIMTALLVVLWEPIPIPIWQIKTEAIRYAFYVVYLMIWGAMLCATFQFGHFGFFGLHQAWINFRNRQPAEASFSARWFYGVVRHPISLCWMLTPWLTPDLTIGQVVFALGITIYIIIATPFEEMDLIGELGDRYRQYQQAVPKFFPRLLKPKESKGLFTQKP